MPSSERPSRSICSGWSRASGLALFWLIGADGSIEDAPKYAAGFFLGAAAWTLLMLLLGYLGCYTRTIAFLLTVPVVAASSRHFHQATCALVAYLRELRRRDIAIVALTVIAIVFGLLLMLVKGLYPAGGHDYFTHYHYLLSVIKHQDLWPNEVWFHYYYDKAMGLFFLAMLLTDPLAPSLATASFVAATAIALFDLVRRFDGAQSAWPFVAVILYFALFIYTPSFGFYELNGGWGDFQKPHEISSSFLIAILWMSVRDRRHWERTPRLVPWYCALRLRHGGRDRHVGSCAACSSPCLSLSVR